MKHKYWVLGILSGLTIIFVLLKGVWGGFIYFAASFLSAVCFYLSAMFIYQYLCDYKWHFDEDFAYYKAQVINSSAISEQDFETAKETFIKKYKNSIARDKIIDIFKILVCISLGITCIVAVCSGLVQ